jgi:hypothetical protein
MNYNFIFSKKFFLFSKIYINLFKNFLNFYYTYLSFSYKFITLDFQHNIFNHLNFNLTELLKFNYFINASQKTLKKQQFLLLFRNFITNSSVKLILIFDFEVYSNYLNFFSSINLYIFSFIHYSNTSQYLDFFIFKSKYFYTFEKILYYSYFYTIYNLYISNKIKTTKFNYLTKYNNIKLINTNTPNKYLQPLIHPINIYNH